MLTLDYRDRKLESSEEIFPAEVNESPWVLFHGTTNVSAPHIETGGFKWDAAIYDKQDIEEVVAIFWKMDWAGLGTDAFLALSSYSLSVDFSDGRTKPVFFSESPEATIGYTNRYRVIGETAGCLAYAIDNLKVFLEDESLREKFRARRYTRLLKTIRGFQLPTRFSGLEPKEATASACLELATYLNDLVGNRIVYSELLERDGQARAYEPWEEDLGWLSTKVKKLSPLRDRLASLREKYDHGVIYAVEFSEQDVSSMRDLRTGLNHGIAYYGALSADRIIAKALIAPDQKRLTDNLCSRGMLNRLKRGITGALMTSSEKQDKIADLEGYYAWR